MVQRMGNPSKARDATLSEANSEDDEAKNSPNAADPSIQSSLTLAKRRTSLSGSGEASILEKTNVVNESWLQNQRPPQRGTRRVSTPSFGL